MMNAGSESRRQRVQSDGDALGTQEESLQSMGLAPCAC
jgi:hypothetical protein